jgi:hypothetical protein
MKRTSAKYALLSLFFMLLSFSGTNPVYAAPPAQASITVDAEKSLGAISPLLYGVFFEEINHAGDGGLYAELIQNRSFEDRPDTLLAWSPLILKSGQTKITLDRSQPLNDENPTSLRMEVTDPGQSGVGVANTGYWGIALQKGKEYRFALHARRLAGSGDRLIVALVAPDSSVIAQREIRNLGEKWEEFEGAFKSDRDSTNARLAVIAPAKGTYWIDTVSLFPADTFKKRRNGLRADLAQMVADLQPAFVRFPGGCFCEGDRIENAFRWKKSIGPIAQRPGHSNLWGYRSSDGLGYHEYLLFCEDIRAEPLFVVNVGMSHAGPVSLEKTQEFVQDALDAIEYANGPTTSPWGALRAKNGHSRPFNLKYMEIGNENGGPAYQERYALFYDAIKKRYPSMRLIANEPTTLRPADIIDEHDYSSPQHFASQTGRYDRYDRKGPKIYMGEYAATEGVGLGNLKAALGESAYMIGMERNSDHVIMSSYAPLFVNVNDRAWNPDAIVFDNHRAFGTPSYTAQLLFAQNRPGALLSTVVTIPEPETLMPATGYIGLGTWRTQAEFKDIQILQSGKPVQNVAVADNLAGWRKLQGDWKAENGIVRQSDAEENRRLILSGGYEKWQDYTVSLKARKQGGAEGFLILFRGKDDKNWYWWNIGGWNNTRHAIEKSENGGKSVITPSVPGKIESNRWYDIRIELSGDHIRCYLDGVLIHDFRDAPQPLHAIAGRSQKGDEIIVKVVNFSDNAIETAINLRGTRNLASQAQVTILTASNPDTENTLENPKNVPVVTSKREGIAPTFSHTFPRWSLTVLRIKDR